MPAHDLRNSRPGELHSGDNLMSNGSVIGHFLKLIRIERAGLAKQPLVHGNFANVVEISSRTQGGDLVGIHAEGVSDARGVTAHAKRMSVNVDVLYINSGGERL